MNITLDKNLQSLRISKGNTQDDLADFLGVTHQTVSKWERGENYPDLTLIPPIAEYYNVTVDDLLGVGEIKKRERIEEYKAESAQYDRTGEAEKRDEVWRRAVAEFPNNLECLTKLMQSLHTSPEGSSDEVIELAERILRESTDSAQRESATQILVLNLMCEERFDEAEKLINTLPDVYITTNRLLCDLCANRGDRERGKNIACNNILTYFELAAMDLYNLCVFNKGDYEHYIKLHEVYLKLADVIFDDGFYGFYNCRIYMRHYWLAKLYSNLHNDEEKARYHLEAAAKCAIDFDSLPEKFTYRGTLFGEGIEWTQKDITRSSTESICERLLHGIDGRGLDDGAFDRWRDKDWFKAVTEKLEKKR